MPAWIAAEDANRATAATLSRRRLVFFMLSTCFGLGRFDSFVNYHCQRCTTRCGVLRQTPNLGDCDSAVRSRPPMTLLRLQHKLLEHGFQHHALQGEPLIRCFQDSCCLAVCVYWLNPAIH